MTGAKEGAEGIELARQHQPDLILLDIHMPKMDGYEVARHLRDDAQCRDIPIVAVTALAMVGDREKLLNSGFNGYISKPIEPETFASKVQAFLGSQLPGGQFHTRPEPGSKQAEMPQPPSARRERLLIVDNSPVNLQLARSILVPSGYEVITAPSVQEGLELARSSRPDMIVSDVHMPHQDGHAFVRLVQEDPELREIPFVFLSSSVSSAHEREKALEEGAARFICRPVDPETLLGEVAACLHRRSKD